MDIKTLDRGNLTPAESRQIFRAERYKGVTAGWSLGYAQCNMVILPKDLAFDFMVFCQRNKKACPVLAVTEPGNPEPADLAKGADVRVDLPRYKVYKKGELIDEPNNIEKYWRDDLVTFLLGCSFSFEEALLRAGVPVRHIDINKSCPVYETSIECERAGIFEGPVVVSMRPIPAELVPKAVTITSRYPYVHGAPLHIGDPEAIGIKDFYHPEWGDPPNMKEGDVPVYWHCGVTPQAVVMRAKPDFVITHYPSHMFITDKLNESLSIL